MIKYDKKYLCKVNIKFIYLNLYIIVIIQNFTYFTIIKKHGHISL